MGSSDRIDQGRNRHCTKRRANNADLVVRPSKSDNQELRELFAASSSAKLKLTGWQPSDFQIKARGGQLSLSEAVKSAKNQLPQQRSFICKGARDQRPKEKQDSVWPEQVKIVAGIQDSTNDEQPIDAAISSRSATTSL